MMREERELMIASKGGARNNATKNAIVAIEK